jgi:hypothetical protein
MLLLILHKKLLVIERATMEEKLIGVKQSSINQEIFSNSLQASEDKTLLPMLST